MSLCVIASASRSGCSSLVIFGHVLDHSGTVEWDRSLASWLASVHFCSFLCEGVQVDKIVSGAGPRSAGDWAR